MFNYNYNDPNNFCYICGSYTVRKQRENISDDVIKLYFSYFGFKLGDQDKYWAQHITCSTCRGNLSLWAKGRKKRMPFAIPMVWREPIDHITDCYFCIVKTEGFNAKNKNRIKYPNLKSAMRPIPHDELDLPIPILCNQSNHDSVSSPEETFDNEQLDKSFIEDVIPKKFSQNELNDLIRELNLSKKLSEVLASRLVEKGLLLPEVKITYYRNREINQLSHFSQNGDFVYCTNIKSLLNDLGVENYRPDEWRLFIDSSKRSLKCVLLHNGNKYSSIPIAHSVKVKETYESVKRALELISYDHHKWVVCVDLKMVCFLLGQQLGYTKFPCFLCEWDSRAKLKHWTIKDWPERNELKLGEHNIINPPLIDRNKIIFSATSHQIRSYEAICESSGQTR